MEFVILRPSMAIPRPAFEAVLDLERAGHSLMLDGEDIIVEPGMGLVIKPDQLAALRHWKPHCRMLLAYTADDGHLFADHQERDVLRETDA